MRSIFGTLAIVVALAASAGATTAGAATGSLHPYVSGGHALGFDDGGYFVSNGSYALHVRFEGAQPVQPHDAGAAVASAAGATARLERVDYTGVWPGIDVAYDAPRGAIARSTWQLAAGADPAAIRLIYNRPVAVGGDGTLHIRFDSGVLSESRPVAWQDVDGERRSVEVGFARLSADTVGFRLGAYRHDLPLSIDPTLTWNTFMGGAGEEYGYGIATDGTGNIYVTGFTDATWGTPVRAYSANADAFVAKLSSTGTRLWSTFLGGSGDDFALGIAVDDSGAVFVAGQSTATWDAPVNSFAGAQDAFAAKLNAATGALTWNTFLGSAAGFDGGEGIAVNGSNVYVVGNSTATWGVGPVRTFSGGGRDAFVAKLASSNGVRAWHTFLGGSGFDTGNAIAADSSAVYVSGDGGTSWGTPVRPLTAGGLNAVAVKLTAATGVLEWNTFLGGAGEHTGEGIAVDATGNVYVVGRSSATWGSPLRLYSDLGDGYAAQLSSAGALVWNTFLGGNGEDTAHGVAVDASGNPYVSGESDQSWGSPQRAFSGGTDAFVERLTSAGAFVGNAFAGSVWVPAPSGEGGTGTDEAFAIAMSGSTAVITGLSDATWGSPVTAFGGSYDVFVAALTIAVLPTVTPTASFTASRSVTPTRTPSLTPTITPTLTASLTPTKTPVPPSSTPTKTQTPTKTATRTPTPLPQHDSVVLAPKPKSFTIPAGTTSITKKLRVVVGNGDVYSLPESHAITLETSSSDCPAGMAATADFGKFATGPSNVTTVAAGKRRTAVVTLTLNSADFESFNRKAPARCTLTVHANAAPLVESSSQNAVATVEISVFDKNDPESEVRHESMLKSVAPVKLTLGDGVATKSKKVSFTVVDADILPAPETGLDTISVTVDANDCPLALVGELDLDAKTAGAQNSASFTGGQARRGSLTLNFDQVDFATASMVSPTRCTLILTSHGAGGDSIAANDTTRIVVDVIDKNDF